MRNAQDHSPTQAQVPTAGDGNVIANLIAEHPPVAPLRDEAEVRDRFGSEDVAARLAEVVQRVEPPYTISLSGSWGVGKTTLARQLKRRLEAHKPPKERVRVVQLDLWTEDLADLRRRLALEVAVELQDDPATAEERAKALKAKAKQLDEERRASRSKQEPPKLSVPLMKSHPLPAVRLLVALIGFLWFLFNLNVPASPGADPVGLKAGLTIVTGVVIWILIQSGLVLSVSTSTTSIPPIEEKVGIRLEFEKLVRGSGIRKALVVLDNLDRLPGDDAVKALAEVRSFVEVEGSRCMFLVPLDRDALVRHLVRQMGGDEQSARDYLDKFFNLDVLLTKPVLSDLRAWTRDQLGYLFPGRDASRLSSVAEIVAAAADGSPRATKRILNGFYTRAYLLPADSAATTTADELAFIEALITQYPAVVERLYADPRQWLSWLDAFRNSSDESERRNALWWLSGRTGSPMGDAQGAGTVGMADDLVAPLRRFLLQTRPVDVREQNVRPILSARVAREWLGVPGSAQIQAALAVGDAAALADALDRVEGDARRVALQAIVDAIVEDQRQSWAFGVLNGMNAAAPLVAADPALSRTLRNTAAETLLTAPAGLARTLAAPAVDFIFGQSGFRPPHEKTLVGRAIGELTPGGTTPATAVVRIVAAVSGRLDAKSLEVAQAALAQLSDEELEPLFIEPAPATSLLRGPVTDMYATRLANWDGTAGDQEQFVRAAGRLQFIRKSIAWSDVTALDAIFERATSQVPLLPSPLLPVIDAIVGLSDGLAATPATSTLARALAELSGGGRLAIELALRLPPNPAIATQVTSALNASAFLDFMFLVEHYRDRMEAVGVAVIAIVGSHWAAGEGAAYANLALARGSDADADVLLGSLTGVLDETVYVHLVEALVPTIGELNAAHASENLLADIAGRVATFKLQTVRDLAPTVAAVQHLASPAPVIGSLSSQVAAAGKTSMAEVTAAVRAFVEAKVAGAESLPPQVAAHGAALGVISLEDATWLAGRQGVRAPDVRTGLLSAIQHEDPSRVLPVAAALQSRLDHSWQVGKALIERAAGAPSGSRKELLEAARRWKLPPARAESDARDEYRAALDRALEGDVSVESVVGELRDKLLS